MRNSFKTLTLTIVCAFASAQVVTAQHSTKKYGTDSVSCITNISLYREVFKQRNYKEAYTPWKAVVTNCPLSTRYIFADGPVILDALIKDEKNQALREQYIKELFELLELRIKCYPEDEGYTLGRMGVFTEKLYPEEYKKVYEYLGKSIDLSGAESSPQVLDLYFQAAEKYMIKEKLSTDTIIEAYDKVSEVMELMLDKLELQLEAVMRRVYELNTNFEEGTIRKEDYDATYETIRKDSAQVANELLQLRNVSNNLDVRFSKHASCEMLQQIYGKRLETSKEERLLRQIIKFFRKKDCTENDIFATAVEELHKISPTASTAFYMGVLYNKKKQYHEALNYFKEAAELYEKESEIINTYIMMADCYIKMGQGASARETANKILRLNPQKGIAYILIGDAYAAAVSSCNTDIPGAAYWAAADKYAKAKSVDASIAETAQKKLNEASVRFPKIETFFQQGYTSGQSYRIECWINETTTIREK